MTNVSNYALRLQTSLLGELRDVVAEEGTTLNQFINVAVAEKLQRCALSVILGNGRRVLIGQIFWRSSTRRGLRLPSRVMSCWRRDNRR